MEAQTAKEDKIWLKKLIVVISGAADLGIIIGFLMFLFQAIQSFLQTNSLPVTTIGIIVICFAIEGILYVNDYFGVNDDYDYDDDLEDF